VVTTGNHVWQRKELVPHLNQSERLLRPLNYPPGAPGRGATVVRTRQGLPVAVVNLQGRTFLPSVDCPFRAARHELERLRRQTTLVVVDFHAEATAEKMALGWYLDGLATAVIGTHTHVQTADERILPQGTAYLTDAGMTGPHASVIGTRPELAIQRFLTQVPVQFKPADGQVRFCGALIEADEATGRAVAIERLQLEVEAGAADDGEGD
jgi:metallophosphoesterase (TIGR00282 family)